MEPVEELRRLVTESFIEVHQKIDATNAILVSRTEALATVTEKMEGIAVTTREITERLFKETEVSFLQEQKRTTDLVNMLAEQIQAVDQGKLSEVANQLLAQDNRDEERMKFVLASLKPEIVQLQ